MRALLRDALVSRIILKVLLTLNKRTSNNSDFKMFAGNNKKPKA